MLAWICCQCVQNSSAVSGCKKIPILSFSDKQQKEKSEWERIEASDCIGDVRTKQTTRPPAGGATHDRDGVSHNGGSSQSTDVFDHKSSAYDLEQREMEIIADLERGEEAGRRITDYHGNKDDLDQFGSRSTGSFSDSGIEARVTLDMRTTVSKTHAMRTGPTGRQTLDLDEERRRMERWDAEQEEKRKVGARGCMLGCGRCRGEVVHQLGAVIYYPLAPLGQLRTSMMIYCPGPL